MKSPEWKKFMWQKSWEVGGERRALVFGSGYSTQAGIKKRRQA